MDAECWREIGPLIAANMANTLKVADKVAAINLAQQTVEYVAATSNGAGAFTAGLSNNVCH